MGGSRGTEMKKGKPRIRLVASLLIALALGPGLASSQTPDAASKFRLASALEQAGDLEHAAQLYRELAARDPANTLFTDALQRTLLQLKRYDEAIALVNDRLQRSPRDATLLTTLGTIYYRAGREKDAASTWDRVLALEPANPNIYRIVASAQVENRLLDRAAETYRRGRAALGDKTLFALELAQLEVATMDYAGATQEFLAWLEQNPSQLSFVQNRLTMFSDKPDGRDAAIRVVQAALHGKEDLRLYDLLGWLYMEGHDYARAYDAYAEVDRLSTAHGVSLLTFADRAARDKAYDIAARAYRAALSAPLPETRRPAAMFGYAMTLMAAGADSSASNVESPPGRIPESSNSTGAAAFQDVIARYPHTPYAALALFQIGVLHMQRDDLDAARQAFDQVRADPSSSPSLRYDVGLKLGSLATLRGDTLGARAAYGVVSAAPDATPDQSDEANFRLAELEYFAGHFEKAAALLEAMSMNLKADIANDAIALRAFLKENLNTPDALLAFARADFVARQHRNTEAIALFQQVVQRFPQSLVVDDALMKIATLQTGAGLFPDAVATYRTLLDKFKESSIELDKAQFRMAEVYERGLKNTPAAIAAYEQLLAAYPNSLLAEQARKRIRSLRGEAQ